VICPEIRRAAFGRAIAILLQEAANPMSMNFDMSPMLVIWETTQACDLSCAHCRASAQPLRNPDELTTGQARALLEEVKRFGSPLMVFTGGDPLKRPDLFELMEYSASLGLRTNVSPSATPLLTPEAVRRFKTCGLARMAVSVDGPDAETHDSFRGVDGSFDRAMVALREAQRIGLETQVQTTITRRNMNKIRAMADMVEQVGGRMWSLFFLVVTGRALAHDDLTPEEYEQVFEALYQVSLTSSYDVKTTEAMHYRRYVAQRLKQDATGESASRKVMYRTAGVSDGKGFVFVSHTGEICPSGFLPISAGNVLRDSLVDVYRNSALFRSLRDMDRREGKCGLCEYRNICGGSRSRAYACTGNYLAEDPRCTYQPGHTKEGGCGNRECASVVCSNN
jgi:radical SAM protein